MPSRCRQRPATAHEQVNGIVLEQFFQRLLFALLRERHGWDTIGLLGFDPQGFPAGGQDVQVRTGLQQAMGQVSAGGYQVLAVIQHQQQVLVTQIIH